jgi:hypothetical protein
MTAWNDIPLNRLLYFNEKAEALSITQMKEPG